MSVTPQLADHFPRGVTDPLCSQEHVIDTSMDRRLLWHLEQAMSGWPRSDSLAATQRALARYLHETCEHHWHDASRCCEPRRDDCYPPHQQCLWCNDVEWRDDAASPASSPETGDSA